MIKLHWNPITGTTDYIFIAPSDERSHESTKIYWPAQLKVCKKQHKTKMSRKISNSNKRQLTQKPQIDD